MECPLCFEMYSDRDSDMAPMKLVCCGLVMCRGCLKSTIANTSRCPWDKTRWISRTFYKKCQDITPADLFQSLQEVQDSNTEDCSLSPSKNALGDGELGKEYARVVEMRQKISEQLHAECIEKDVKLAAEILAAERLAEEDRLREQEEIARRDAEYALKLTSSQSPIQEQKFSLKRPREITDFLTVNSAKKNLSDSTPSISAWLSGRSRPKPITTAKLPNAQKNNSKYSDSDAERSKDDFPYILHETPGTSNRKEIFMVRSEEGSSCSSPSMSQLILIDCESPIATAAAVWSGSKPTAMDGTTSLTSCITGWCCGVCTFENHSDLSECEMCCTKRS